MAATGARLPPIVIVGRGGGGPQAARSLRGAALAITLADRTRHHLLEPGLPGRVRRLHSDRMAARAARQEITMSIRIVRLGTPRTAGEGLRLGTVRRPPRGVPKTEFAKRDFYDTWLPNLSPSAPLMAQGQAAGDDRSWAAFKRKFNAEMKQPEASHLLDLLAALSHQTTFSLGCYCEDENHCHRSVLRELLAQRGAAID